MLLGRGAVDPHAVVVPLGVGVLFEEFGFRVFPQLLGRRGEGWHGIDPPMDEDAGLGVLEPSGDLVLFE